MLAGCCTGTENYLHVQKVGFDYIELSGKNVGAMSENAFSEFESLVRKSPLPCYAFNAYSPADIIIAGPRFDQASSVDYARHIAARASRLGVKVVNVGSPKSRLLPEGFDLKLAFDQAQTFFRDTAAVFSDFGITVTVEALGYCFCNFINKTEEAVNLIESLGQVENLGLVLDFYNMRQSGETDLDLKTVSKHILHVHDSDDLGSPNLRSYYLQENELIHARDLQSLKATGYDGGISIETDIPFDPEAAAYSLRVIREAWKCA